MVLVVVTAVLVCNGFADFELPRPSGCSVHGDDLLRQSKKTRRLAGDDGDGFSRRRCVKLTASSTK